jgi:hypothetical protein
MALNLIEEAVSELGSIFSVCVGFCVYDFVSVFLCVCFAVCGCVFVWASCGCVLLG